MGVSGSLHYLYDNSLDLKTGALLTYEQFVESINTLNRLSHDLLDSKGKQIYFCIKTGTDNSFLWKFFVRINCFKVLYGSETVDCVHILNLKQYLHLYSQITRLTSEFKKQLFEKEEEQEMYREKKQERNLEESSEVEEEEEGKNENHNRSSNSHNNINKSNDQPKIPDFTDQTTKITFYNNNNNNRSEPLTSETFPNKIILPPQMNVSTLIQNAINNQEGEKIEEEEECVICMVEKKQVVLPCSHGYCEKCIEKWQSTHKDCPICRSKVKSIKENWVFPDKPDKSEVSNHSVNYLIKLINKYPREQEEKN